MKYIIFIIMLAISISGCSYIRGSDSYYQKHKKEYLNSHNGNPLVIPPGLSDAKMTNDYVISPVVGQPGIQDTPPGIAHE